MALQPFPIAAFTVVNQQDPTEQEINTWTTELNDVIAALDNIIQFFGLTTPVIPQIHPIAAGADLAARLAQVITLTGHRTQIILFQGQVMAEARAMRQRASIKTTRPSFDGSPESARGFHAAVENYRVLRAADFPNDETFIAWALGCMEGPRVNPWRNALMNQRARLQNQGQPLPALLTAWGNFLTEFNGKFLDPNEVENTGRALAALRQIRSAREFAQEFDRLAELAGVTGEDFLIDQFRRNLKTGVQEKILRQQFNTLRDVQVAAIEWDDALFQFKRLQRSVEQKRPSAIPRTQGKPTNGSPMQLDYTSLTPEESERRRKAGLCFRCGKQGHIGRNCPDKSKATGSGRPGQSYSKLATTQQEPEDDDATIIADPRDKDFQDD